MQRIFWSFVNMPVQEDNNNELYNKRSAQKDIYAVLIYKGRWF